MNGAARAGSWEETVRSLRERLRCGFDKLAAELRSEAEHLAQKPPGSDWSRLEIGEHVVLANHYLLILAGKIAAKARRRRARGQPAALAPSSFDHLEKLAARTFSWSSPAHMRPAGNLDPATILGRLEEQRRRCFELLD
jgi:hypothetical protein